MSEIKTLKFPGDTEPREIVDAKAREDISKLSEEKANLPLAEDGTINAGISGQYATSDGKGGFNWKDGPTTLPNPNAITFTGAVTGSYDGSAPLEVKIPSGGGGTSGDYIPIPATAEVGQTIVVKAVDENGKPTEWEAADMASGTLGEDDVPVYLGTIPVSPDTALYLVAPVKDYKKVIIVKERTSYNDGLTSYLYVGLYQPVTKKNVILAAFSKPGYSFAACKSECVSNDFAEGEIVYGNNATMQPTVSGMIPHSSVFSNSVINQNMPIDIDSYYYEFHVANASLAFDGSETVHVWGWKR